MNFLIVLLILFSIYGFVIVGKNIFMSMYSRFDHSFLPSTRLKRDAKIVDMSSEPVIYEKNNAKYKTKVTFSDGFVFTTYKTNWESESFFKYRISIDNELAIEIMQRALAAHEKAYRKQISS